MAESIRDPALSGQFDRDFMKPGFNLPFHGHAGDVETHENLFSPFRPPSSRLLDE